jgi:hypothetical protein
MLIAMAAIFASVTIISIATITTGVIGDKVAIKTLLALDVLDIMVACWSSHLSSNRH